MMNTITIKYDRTAVESVLFCVDLWSDMTVSAMNLSPTKILQG